MYLQLFHLIPHPLISLLRRKYAIFIYFLFKNQKLYFYLTIILKCQILMYLDLIIIIIRIQDKMMECQENQPIFSQLYPEELQRLQNNKIQASCQFYIKVDKTNYQGSIIQNSKHVLLQIRSNYIVQCDKRSLKIQSGVPLNSSINFHLFEANPQQKNNFSNKYLKQRCFLHIWNPHASSKGFLSVADPQELYFRQYELIYTPSANFDNFKTVIRSKDIIHGIKDLKLLFKPLRCLGSKDNSKLYQSLRVKDKKKYIIQAYGLQALKNHSDLHRILAQFYILRKLPHENFIKIVNIYKTQNTLYIIKPYYQINLTEFNKFNTSKIENTRIIIAKILYAVQFMHSNYIVHTKINADNIIIRHKDGKIIDIAITGFSNAFIFQELQNKNLNPQNQKKIEFQVLASQDLQATGYLLYQLLTEKYQFQYDPLNAHKNIIVEQMISQLEGYFQEIPESALDLFKELLGIQKKGKRHLQNSFIKQYQGQIFREKVQVKKTSDCYQNQEEKNQI